MQEIVGNKVGPLIELPENFSLVEVKPFAPYKAKDLEEIKASVEEMILIKAGKLNVRDAEELFNEI